MSRLVCKRVANALALAKIALKLWLFVKSPILVLDVSDI